MSQPLTAAVRFLSGEREPVRVATTGNLSSMQGLLVIDDVELDVGDRVLVKDQTDAVKNGIWLASGGVWFRAPDASYSRAINEGVTVGVQEGTVNNGRTYRFASSNPVVGVDPISIIYLYSDSAGFASASQGELADSAVQPGDLGDSAGLDVGTTAGTVAAGNDTRIVNALQKSYENTVTVADFGALPDCTDVGVGTDVDPAILDAWDYAIANIGNGARIILPAGRYRLATPIVLDGLGAFDIKLEMFGSITPDNVAMRCIEIRNVNNLEVKASAFKGGRWTSGAANEGYYADYATANVVAGGGQEFIAFSGVFNYLVDISAYGYGGRAVRVTTRSNVSHPETGAIKGSIRTSRDDDFSKPRVAQSIFSDTATVGQGNWGHLDTLICNFDIWGPQWENWNDISVTEIDYAGHLTGPTLKGCVVAEFGQVYVGTISGDVNNRHFVIGPSASRNSSQVRADRMRFLDVGNGLYIKDASGVKIGKLDGGGTGALIFIHIDNSQKVTIDKASYSEGTQALYVSGANCDQIYVNISTGELITDNHVLIASDVNGAITIDNAILTVAASGKSLIKVDGLALVQVNNPVLFSTNGNLLDLVASNNVHLRGGSIGGAAGLHKTAVARTILGTKGTPENNLETPLKLAGNSAWAPPASDFDSSATGSRKLPDGTIEKWGTATGAAGDIAVTFATAFPTKVLAISLTMVGAGVGTGSLLVAHAESITASGFTLKRRFQTGSTTGQAAESCNWRVIGH